MINEAKKNAAEMIQKAKSEADSKYNEILKEARAKADEIINLAIEEGNFEAKPILEKGEKEVYAIKNVANDVKENAVNIVVERIVKSYGNS